MRNTKKPVVLVILDGFGLAPASKGNAVYLAKTPFIDHLFKKYPNTKLRAFGRAVGLPQNQHGNSEAGHMNIGAGRIVDQDSIRISKSINDGTFFKNPAFLEAINHVKRNKSRLHVMGLLSREQSPHMDPDHLLALLILLQKKKINPVFLHLFTDGRDSPQYIAIELVKKIKKTFENNEKIATVSGRFYLDRKKKWEVTEKIYNALILGEGAYFSEPSKAILHGYNKGLTDEFIEPSVIGQDRKEVQASRISDKDSVIFYNLRSDRARQLTKPFVQVFQQDFNKMNSGSFTRKKVLKSLRFVVMTDFGPDLPGVLTAYPSLDIEMSLPMVLANKKQLYIAEAEKYAHVTYFINGGYDHSVGGEDRILINSPDVKVYDKVPEMSSPKILGTILEKIRKDIYHFICVNFCNPDMIGHTGNIKASIKAIEYLDGCLSDLVKGVFDMNGSLFITADHGNCEEMIDLKSGEVNTEHTSNLVPFIMVSKGEKRMVFEENGVLGNIAPTILDFMKIKKPKQMIKDSLCRM